MNKDTLFYFQDELEKIARRKRKGRKRKKKKKRDGFSVYGFASKQFGNDAINRVGTALKRASIRSAFRALSLVR